MDERTRRVGRNEAVFREVNEQIESLNRGLAALSDNTMRIVCECADLLCTVQLTVSVSAYERIRSDSLLFFVEPGHEVPELEDVVERDPGYFVVRKSEREAQQMAEATDPRT